MNKRRQTLKPLENKGFFCLSLLYRNGIRLYLLQVTEAYSRLEAQAHTETAVIPQVIRYLTEHFREPLRLDDLAARFFISKSYLPSWERR